MKKLYALVLSLGPAVAFAYPIDVDVVTRGLDISFESIEQRGATVLHLRNHEPVTVHCSVLFNAGVESRRRQAVIAAGDGQTLQFTPRREVVRMRVRVECEPKEERPEE